MDIEGIKNYLQDLEIPMFRIRLRYIFLPLLIGLLLFLGSSFIRNPELTSPPNKSRISRMPVFKILPEKNAFYLGYEIKLYYRNTKEEIPVSVFEEGATVVIRPYSRLRGNSETELAIKIKKGFKGIALWSRTFKYQFTTTQEMGY